MAPVLSSRFSVLQCFDSVFTENWELRTIEKTAWNSCCSKVLIGFTVGTLIGLTGLGGGVLLLPMLIFGLHVPAIIAVGSDALFNFFTKIPASIMHLWKGTVREKSCWRWRSAAFLALTSA